MTIAGEKQAKRALPPPPDKPEPGAAP
jgi:hypothetical protein